MQRLMFLALFCFPQLVFAQTTTFTESFNSAPDYTNNWQLYSNYGGTTLTYTPGNFQITASQSSPYPPGSSMGFISKQAWVGNIDVSFQLNHGGYGRTSVYLWSKNLNQPTMGADLDTDDTAYLNFTSGSNSTQYLYSSAPYLNRWITLRIQVVGSNVNFYADNGSGLQLLQTFPVSVSSPPDAYYLFFGVGSVPWKSGNNNTSFQLITATGTPFSSTGTITLNSNQPQATFSISPPIAGAPTTGPYPVTLQNVPVGTYTATFNPIAGYTVQQPSPQTQTLPAGGTISFTGTYTPLPTTGTINVTTNLPGATFAITGQATYSGSGTSFTQANAPSGSYTITYGAVSGYTTPSSQTQTLAAGGTINFSGTYTSAPTPGTIFVNTNLSGATFTITGPATYNGSGTTFTQYNAPVGTYTITYGGFSGYTTPSSQTQTLAAGGTITFSGTYTSAPTPGTILVNTNLSGATFSISGPATYSGSGTYYAQYNAPPGAYTITFGGFLGYTRRLPRRPRPWQPAERSHLLAHTPR